MIECDCKLQKVLEQTILMMSDSENMDEAIDYFEENRHNPHPLRTEEYFNQISISQLGILFKLLLDTNQLKLINNKITQNDKTL